MTLTQRVKAVFRLGYGLPLLLAAIFAVSPAWGQDTPPQPAALSDAFANVAKTVEPTVVSIDTRSRPAETARRRGGTPSDSDDILEFLGRQFPPRPTASVGSGFIVDRTGHIVTNHHVVEDASRILVRLNSGEEFIAALVGFDSETDLAVLKIDAGRDLPFVRFGDSDRVRVGEWVLALGSPFGLSRTVTAGIISHVGRETPQSSPFQRFIQTDAAINRGNSGGPLVDLSGNVIGVNSQIATMTGDYNGVGFALPASEVVRVFDQIRSNGKVRRGYLGITLDSVKPEFAKIYEMEDERGAIVLTIADEAGPAAKAGLLPGDVIVSFNGQPVADARDLIGKVASVSPDRSVEVTFLRENAGKLERRSVPLVLAERMPRVAAADDKPRKLPVERAKEQEKPFGLTVADVTPDVAASLRLTGQKGAVVKEINPDSFIADVKISAGADALGEGDIIQRINRISVGNAAEFAAVVAKLKKGDPVVMHVLTPVVGPSKTQLKVVQFTVK